MDEDPRVTTARQVLAEVDRATHSTDPDAVMWTTDAIAARHGRLRAALAGLLAYIDGEAP